MKKRSKLRNFKTKIKRGDLIYSSGVGAVIRTENGVLGVVACLADWLRALPVSKVAGQYEIDKENFLLDLEIRDPELEDACKVARFIQPPREPEEESWKRPVVWEVPLYRFPLIEICSNSACQQLKTSHPGDGKRSRCSSCKKKSWLQQVPIFRACPEGHLDDIDFTSGFPLGGSCVHSKLKTRFGNSPRKALVTCLSCNQSAVILSDGPCTGRRPWVSGSTPDTCSRTMRVVERTAVNTYFASSKSSIHIPIDSNIDELLIRWLQRMKGRLKFFDARNQDNLAILVKDAVGAGFQPTAAEMLEHLAELAKRTERHQSIDDWDVLAARANEFEVLAGHRTYGALDRSSLLRFRTQDLNDYSHPFIGKSELITAITSIDVLTETRALDGFSRIDPAPVSARLGYRQMWGFDKPNDDPWLLAYRLHGEGVFLELNRNHLPQLEASEVNSLNESALARMSSAGVVAHSLAHLLIKEFAVHSGYQLPSIRDRIYDLPDGRIGILIYTAEGDMVGTLGGLVLLSEPGTFERLLTTAIEAGHWCGQDPICIGKIHAQAKGVGAACHQCLLLPETSCERFNHHLDRRSLLAGKFFRELSGKIWQEN